MNYILFALIAVFSVVALILFTRKPKVVPETGSIVSSKNGTDYVFLRVTKKNMYLFRMKGKMISMDLGSLKSMGLTKRYDFKSIRKN